MPKEIEYSSDYMALLDAPVDDAAPIEDFDADADYARPAPPIEDGYYFANIKNAGVFVDGKLLPYRESQWSNETRKYHEVGVVAEIIKPEDPIAHGKHVYTNMPLRTKPDPERGNASGISAAYKALAGEPIAGMPGPAHARQFVELLRTEPQAWVQVQNVLRDVDAEKEARAAGQKGPKAVYGQKKIMALKGGTNAQGKFTGAADHPVTGNRCVARPYIAAFKPRDFDPADPYSKNKAVTA
jgi:hypothetical protein